MVGVPGRVVQQRVSEQDVKRHEIAAKIGFDAYGTTPDMPDPVANAINLMLDHIHALDNRVEELTTTIRDLGGRLDGTELPELDECQIDSTAPPRRQATP